MPIIKKASITTTKTALQFDEFGIREYLKSSYTTSLDDVEFKRVATVGELN